MSKNELVIIPKIEKYIEYMLTILIKLPRTEKTTIVLGGLCSNIELDYMIYGLYTVQVLDIKGGLFLIKNFLSK